MRTAAVLRLSGTFATLFMLLAPRLLPAQTCSVTSNTYNEKFTTGSIDPATSTPGYDKHPGSVRLNERGGGFSSATSGNFSYVGLNTRRLQAAVSGDFNGDGTEDLIALNAIPSCELAFIPNNSGSLGTGSPIASASCSNRVGATLASGDVDGDGRLDFVMVTVTELNAGTVASATFYRNTGTVLAKPTFQAYDFTAALTGDNVAWHVAGSTIDLADFNNDGRADLVVLSSAANTSRVLKYTSNSTGTIFTGPGTVLLSDAKMATPIATTNVPAPVGYACMPAIGTSVGGTVLGAADFNGDGTVDLVVGSVSEKVLHTFAQNADASFTPTADINLSAGGPLFLSVADMDRDGSPDITYFRSGNNCDGGPGEAWVLYNDGSGNMNLNTSQLAFGHSLTFATTLNLDNDANKTPEVLAGRHNATGAYAAYKNLSATNLYNLKATTTSKTTSVVNPSTQSIISIKINSYTNSVPASTVLQVSNDGGANWESLNSTEAVSGGKEHAFSHFGSDLRWRAIMTGTPAVISGANAVYSPAATSTPIMTALNYTYNSVPKMTYSRSALGSGTFGSAATARDLLYSADFIFPSFLGQLYAFNLAGVDPTTAPSTSLQAVNGGLAPVAWEAGAQLATRGAGARRLYLAYPSPAPTGAGTDPLTLSTARLTGSDATLAQVSALAGSLGPQLGTATGSVSTQAGLYTYLMGAMGDSTGWKLRDPGHASPVFVGAPAGDANYLGSTYAAFQTANANRTPTVYMGANDGMLHAFDASTGAETWGLVPFNLINRMLGQGKLNADKTTYTYNHTVSVDATPTIADVYTGSAWRTIAVGGQGAGLGLGSNGYYYGIDVTDPSNPAPLWEFSDIWANPRPACQLNNNSVTTCTPNCSTDLSSGHRECSTYDSFFAVGRSVPGAINFSHLDDGDCVGDFANSFSCGFVEFTFQVTAGNAGTYYPYFGLNNPLNNRSGIIWSLDRGSTQTVLAPRGNNAVWTPAGPISLSVGEHTIQFTDVDANNQAYFSTLAIQTPATAPSSATPTETCLTVYDLACSAPTCTSKTYSSPSAVAWPQCGSGANLQCCGDAGGDQYCAPVGGTCNLPETVQGQTLSPPAIGQLKTTSGGVWAAFFASGYNARQAPNVGRSIYAVNATTGALLAQWPLDDIASSASNPSTIDNTVPGGITLVDVDNDGFVDRAYIGDLEGRLWKLNLRKAINYSGANPADYPICRLFDAGDVNGTGTRTWAPIITKPAVAMLDPNQPNVYFGTGGDDRAPDTIMYKFYSVQDTDAPGNCRSTPIKESTLSLSRFEWVVGDGRANDTGAALTGASAGNEGVVGERYWADPIIVNNNSIYFASLFGDIESVNACTAAGAGQSKVYAYAISNFTDASNIAHKVGVSLLGTNGNIPYLTAAGKVRRSAMVRGNSSTGGVVHGAATASTTTQKASDVFIQSATGAGTTGGAVIERLANAGTAGVKAKLRLLRWREVPF